MNLKQKLAGKIDQSLARLGTYLLPYKGKIFVSIIFMLATGGFSSLLALLLGKVTDLGFYDQQSWIIAGAPLALIFISSVHGVCQFMAAYILSKVSQSVLVTLRAQLYDSMIHWPAEVVQRNSTGRISSKFVNEANVALSNAATSTITLVRDSLQVFCLIFVLVYHNWQLTIVTLVVGPAVVYTLRTISKKMRKVVSESQASIGAILTRVQEGFEAQRVIKIYNNYNMENLKFQTFNENQKKLVLKMKKIGSLGTPITQVITMVGVGIVVAVALFEAQQGLLTMGEFVTFLSAMLLIMPPLRHLAGLNATFTMISVASKSIFSALDQKREVDTGKIVAGVLRGEFKFQNVSLKYPGAKNYALRKFNLAVKSGEKIALVGVSGSGKSSLVNLIPRFWNPTGGRIFIDGVDISDYTLESLRNQISIVSQEVILFDDTIRNNIAYGKADVSDKDIENAVEAAALTSFIKSLPKGLETRVGEAGNRLSGGQRQRISIARAFLKNTPIVIFDEATSALDSESEAHIKDAISRLMKGRTSFTVAHRLSTIEDVDRIVVMAGGEIKEIGSHHELLRKNGIYANLYRLQFVHER